MDIFLNLHENWQQRIFIEKLFQKIRQIFLLGTIGPVMSRNEQYNFV